MVNHLKRLWKDKCTIETTTSTTKPNGATGKVWSVLVEDEPCKLSFFDSVAQTNSASNVVGAAEVFQQIKLFIRPDLEIPAGSRITVIRKNRELHYEASSISEQFTNHQEIILKDVQRWA